MSQIPPLDPEAAPQVADADENRLREYLRRKLAEGCMNPSRERLMRAELQRLERLAA